MAVGFDMRINKSTARLDSPFFELGLQFCYFFVLLYIYQRFVVDLFSYEGFRDQFNSDNIYLGLAAIVICTLSIKRRLIPSYFFLNACLALIVVPSMVLFCGADLSMDYYLVTVIAFLTVSLTSRIHVVRVGMDGSISPEKMLRLLIGFAATVVLALLVLSGGKMNFDLSAVYDYREEMKDSLPGIFGYINPVAAKVVVPFGVVISVALRKWSFAGFFVFVSVMLFAFTAHKSPIFTPFVLLFIYWAARSRKIVLYIIAALLLVCLACAVDFFVAEATGHGGLLGTLFVRRVILVPSLLNWFYVDWFSFNDFYFWAESKITFGLVENPYDMRTVNLIGYMYRGKEDLAANTGWIGSGYANAGHIGVILYSCLVGALLSFVDACAKRLGFRLVVAMFFFQFWTIFLSADLTSVIFTHGLVVAVFILLKIKFIPEDGSRDAGLPR